MKINREGMTRLVILTDKYAIKIPNWTRKGQRWKLFLHGLMANMQEVKFSKMNRPEFCPVVWFIRGGWLLVMPRVII